MERLIALLLLLCMAFTYMPALADTEYIGNMEVVNCNEWVSLREQPDTTAKRLVKVSLGAIVSNCEQLNEEWIYAEYDGYSGYILAQYLEPSDNRLTFSAMMVTILDGAPFYATIDSTEPIDVIPANTIVRNCCIMDNDRIYVEWGGRCGFVSLMHAEVYNEMLHFPSAITLYETLYAQADEHETTALRIADVNDFPIKDYNYNIYEYTDFMEADSEDLPKVKFVLYSDEAICKVHLFSVSMIDWDDEDGVIAYEATLEDIQYQFAPEHPLCVGAVIWGDMPNLAVGFEDAAGKYHFAFIEISGEDGSLMLREF